MISCLRSIGPLRSFAMILPLLAANQGRGAELDYPLAVAVDASGAIYIADLNSPCIWKAVDGQLAVYFQGQKQFRTPLNRPRCLAIDAEGRLLAGDTSTREVYRFNAEGVPEPLTAGGIGTPMAIAVNAEGEIFVADMELHRIWKVPAAGGTPELFAEVPAPRGLCFDAEGRLYVVSGEAGNSTPLVRVSPDGTIEPVAKSPFVLPPDNSLPHHVVLDAEGNAYVTDNYANAIWRVTPTGEQAQWFSGEPLKSPVGLAWKGTSLLVADPKIPALIEITPEKQATKVELAPSP